MPQICEGLTLCFSGEPFLLSPTAILVAVHSIPAGGASGVPLAGVMGALNVCLSQRDTFTAEALAAALFILVDRCACVGPRPAQDLIW